MEYLRINAKFSHNLHAEVLLREVPKAWLHIGSRQPAWRKRTPSWRRWIEEDDYRFEDAPA